MTRARLTAAELAALRALEAAATPGPWVNNTSHDGTYPQEVGCADEIDALRREWGEARADYRSVDVQASRMQAGRDGADNEVARLRALLVEIKALVALVIAGAPRE